MCLELFTYLTALLAPVNRGKAPLLIFGKKETHKIKNPDKSYVTRMPVWFAPTTSIYKVESLVSVTLHIR